MIPAESPGITRNHPESLRNPYENYHGITLESPWNHLESPWNHHGITLESPGITQESLRYPYEHLWNPYRIPMESFGIPMETHGTLWHHPKFQGGPDAQRRFDQPNGAAKFRAAAMVLLVTQWPGAGILLQGRFEPRCQQSKPLSPTDGLTDRKTIASGRAGERASRRRRASGRACAGEQAIWRESKRAGGGASGRTSERASG